MREGFTQGLESKLVRCWGVLRGVGGCWAVLGSAGRCWGVLGRAGRCWRVLGVAEGCWAVLGGAGSRCVGLCGDPEDKAPSVLMGWGEHQPDFVGTGPGKRQVLIPNGGAALTLGGHARWLARTAHHALLRVDGVAGRSDWQWGRADTCTARTCQQHTPARRPDKCPS